MVQPAQNDLALVVFLPDAMRLDLWASIGKLLSGLGATVQSAWPVLPTAALHADIYRDALMREVGLERLPKRRLLPALFTLDMAIAALLRRDGGGLLADLGALKGSADPSARRRGTLRALAPLAERGMSLVHVPDNAHEMARQAQALLPGIPFDALADQPAQGPAAPAALGRLRGLVEMRAEVARADLPLRIIERSLLALLWDPRFVPDPALRAVAARLAEPLAPAESRAGRFAFAARELEAARPPVFGACVAEGAAQQDLHARYDDLLHAARALSNPAALTLDDGPRLADRVGRHGLFLDPWERHCLSVFCAFPATNT